MLTTPALLIHDVSRRLVSTSAAFHLSVPSFTASAGDFVAVVGDSGCGKSTLLDLLGLVSCPDSVGSFLLHGENGEEHDVARHWQLREEPALASLRKCMMGYVMQTGGLFPYLTIWDNLLLPAGLKNRQHSRQDVNELAAAFNLAAIDDAKAQSAFYRKKPRHLSGGQRQRTAIMRALLGEPAIILADEPTAAIDSITADKIVSRFSELASRRGIIIIMVTHDRRLVRSVANKAYTFDLDADADSGQVHSLCRELDLKDL